MAIINSSDGQSKRKFLETIARLYYTNNLNQKEISEQLGVSRSSVARFLIEARSAGIVQIRIGTDAQERRVDLEQKVIDSYLCREVMVIASDSMDVSGMIAAEYLDTVLPFKGMIGLGGGKTLYNIGKHLRICERREDVKVVQLTGSLGSVPETSITKQWSQSLDAEGCFMYAPLVARDTASRTLYMNDGVNQKNIEAYGSVDVAIVGVGSMDLDSRISYAASIKGVDYKELQKTSVGDVLFHFFDSHGDFCQPELSDKVVGISRTDYKKIPLKIGIAFGDHKSEAVRGALRGGLIDVLITDELLASSLVE